jgi:hypothetical protein
MEIYKDFSSWLNNHLSENWLFRIVAVKFNLHEGAEQTYDIELIGCRSLGENDNNWDCDTTFTTKQLFSIPRTSEIADKKQGFSFITDLISEYIADGKYRDYLLQCIAVGVGFIDGDNEIIHRCKDDCQPKLLTQEAVDANPDLLWETFIDVIDCERINCESSQEQGIATKCFMIDREVRKGGFAQSFAHLIKLQRQHYPDSSPKYDRDAYATFYGALKFLGADSHWDVALKALQFKNDGADYSLLGTDDWYAQRLLQFNTEDGEKDYSSLDAEFCAIKPTISELLKIYFENNMDCFVKIQQEREMICLVCAKATLFKTTLLWSTWICDECGDSIILCSKCGEKTWHRIDGSCQGQYCDACVSWEYVTSYMPEC